MHASRVGFQLISIGHTRPSSSPPHHGPKEEGRKEKCARHEPRRGQVRIVVIVWIICRKVVEPKWFRGLGAGSRLPHGTISAIAVEWASVHRIAHIDEGLPGGWRGRNIALRWTDCRGFHILSIRRALNWPSDCNSGLRPWLWQMKGERVAAAQTIRNEYLLRRKCALS